VRAKEPHKSSKPRWKNPLGYINRPSYHQPVNIHTQNIIDRYFSQLQPVLLVHTQPTSPLFHQRLLIKIAIILITNKIGACQDQPTISTNSTFEATGLRLRATSSLLQESTDFVAVHDNDSAALPQYKRPKADCIESKNSKGDRLWKTGNQRELLSIDSVIWNTFLLFHTYLRDRRKVILHNTTTIPILPTATRYTSHHPHITYQHGWKH